MSAGPDKQTSADLTEYSSHADEMEIQPTEFEPVDVTSFAKKPWVKPVTLLFGLVFVMMVGIIWYVFSARSVYLSFQPQAEKLNIAGGWSFKIGDRYLLREGDYELEASVSGYYPLQQKLTVTDQQNQTFEFVLDKLPGLLTVSSLPEPAEVLIDGVLVGNTPVLELDVVAGEHQIELQAERYLPQSKIVQVEGRRVKQSLTIELTPAWSDLSLSTSPAGANVMVDGVERGKTPLTLEVMQGEREVALMLPGFKDWRTSLSIAPNQPLTLPQVDLQVVDGLVQVVTRPANANVTVNDQFRGQAPLLLALKPGQDYRISVFKSGFQQATRTVEVKSGVEQSLEIQLLPVLAEIKVRSQPVDAKVYVDGVYRGEANQVFKLSTQRHRLEVRKPGYITYETWVTPREGIEQQISVRLKTLEQAKWESIKLIIKAPSGQTLKLFRPGKLTMGASRREAGRRANEILREVELTRAFYMSLKEVTNEQYRQFEDGWSSGHVKGNSLNGDSQPVVSLSWEQAARYCNWLSEQESLPLVYQVEDDKIVGFDMKVTGYRLPSEAEWAWSARKSTNGILKYPWGEALPPVAQSGNYADRSAAFVVGRVVEKYNDNYAVTAPVGSFPVNQHGLYDMGGNVAEWMNDYYGTPTGLSKKVVLDPAGPESGKYHVVKGSSWAHGTITELRLSYRDYGVKGRNDIGFRIARYVE